MKFLSATMIAAAAVAVLAVADEVYVSPVTGKPVKPGGKYTVEQIKARDERVMKKTGGFLVQKAEGPLVHFIDSRAKPRISVDEVARVYKLATHLDAVAEKDPRGGMSSLAFARKKMTSAVLMAVVVVDDDELPVLSIFPEERIGIVNAARLTGGDDPSAPELRVCKEMWRAMGFIGGIGFSPEENDIMQPYYSVKEIDANRYPFIQPMNMAKMQRMWRRFGVKKARRIPYVVACREGWAPAPTNDVQRAIFEQVKADKERGPTNPITIPPPSAAK